MRQFHMKLFIINHVIYGMRCIAIKSFGSGMNCFMIIAGYRNIVQFSTWDTYTYTKCFKLYTFEWNYRINEIVDLLQKNYMTK